MRPRSHRIPAQPAVDSSRFVQALGIHRNERCSSSAADKAVRRASFLTQGERDEQGCSTDVHAFGGGGTRGVSRRLGRGAATHRARSAAQRERASRRRPGHDQRHRNVPLPRHRRVRLGKGTEEDRGRADRDFCSSSRRRRLDGPARELWPSRVRACCRRRRG